MKDDYKPDNQRLREATFKAFNGKCFYTGQKITKGDMVIDHIVPKSKGGKDSIYNYAPTTDSINHKKYDYLDKEGVVPVLYLIKMIYVPKVLKELQKTEFIKRDMIRATIYVERQVWQGMKVAAHDHWLSLGAYLTEAHHNLNKVNNPDKVHNPQVPEKVTEVEKPEKVESSSSTGGSLSYGKKEPKEKVISGLGDNKRKVKNIIEEIPGVQSASDIFNPQPKGKKQ